MSPRCYSQDCVEVFLSFRPSLLNHSFCLQITHFVFSAESSSLEVPLFVTVLGFSESSCDAHGHRWLLVQPPKKSWCEHMCAVPGNAAAAVNPLRALCYRK